MAKHKKKQVKQIKNPRNPYAFDPIMRKGGVHEKTTKAKRKNAKQYMKRELNQLPFDFYGAINGIVVLTRIRFIGNVPLCEGI